ncbi:hypothetical protein V4C85_02320 [Ralstonia solanacearum]|uniref:hypothetical protein n=1 Tax=Ralstonia solanacearum TaxID=305 RepID=UPI000AB2C2A8|nr:hypothetical protein [Ralstonia solanacearum]
MQERATHRKLTLVADQPLAEAIAAERARLAGTTGLRPSTSETIGALVRRALSQNDFHPGGREPLRA